MAGGTREPVARTPRRSLHRDTCRRRKKAKERSLTRHGLPHRFGQWPGDIGFNTREVQPALGRANEAMTRRYEKRRDTKRSVAPSLFICCAPERRPNYASI